MTIESAACRRPPLPAQGGASSPAASARNLQRSKAARALNKLLGGNLKLGKSDHKSHARRTLLGSRRNQDRVEQDVRQIEGELLVGERKDLRRIVRLSATHKPQIRNTSA